MANSAFHTWTARVLALRTVLLDNGVQQLEAWLKGQG